MVATLVTCSTAGVMAASAKDRLFVIEGRGYGHGVGMGQYGADGFAAHGLDYRAVLAHYYPGTKLAKVPRAAHVRVLLVSSASTVVVSSVTPLRLRDGRGNSVLLTAGRYSIDRSLRFHQPGRFVSPVAPVRVEPTTTPVALAGRPYRGALILNADGAGLSIVNDVPIDDYVQGVVAWEMPASWHQQALRAQAVAARSYALASLTPSRSFDVYPDQRSQMYGGMRAERAGTNRAVRATAGEVLVWNGRVASTYFSSSTGGRTANARDAWPGGRGAPYLVSVPDPYDSRSPNHHWGPYLLSAGTLAARLGLSAINHMRVITDRSGRVAFLETQGDQGTQRVSGAAAARALGLRSTLFTIYPRGSPHPSPRSAVAAKPTPAPRTDLARAAVLPQSPHAAAAARSGESLRNRYILLVAVAVALVLLCLGLVSVSLRPLSSGRADAPVYPRPHTRMLLLAGLAVLAAATGSAIKTTTPNRGVGLGPSASRPAPPTQQDETKTARQKRSALSLAQAGAPRLPRLPSQARAAGELSWRDDATQGASARQGQLARPRNEGSARPGQAPSWTLQGEGPPPRPPAPLQIRDLEIRSTSSSAFSISWRTNLPASTQGARALGAAPVIWTEPTPPTLEHTTVVQDLEANSSYRIWLQAHDGFGQTASTSVSLTTLDAPAATDTTTAGDTILVNGQPTFPIMLWALCASEVASKLAQGISLFIGNGCGSDRQLLEATHNRALAVVNSQSTIQDQPGILGWYYPDEWDAHLDSNVQAEQLKGTLVEPKPGRISFLTLTNHFYSKASPLPQGKGMYPTLFAIADVLGFDLYPLQSWCRPGFSDVFDAQAELHASTDGKPTFQWIEVGPMEHLCNTDPQLDPTPATVRAETWLAIAGGADGVGYFPNTWSSEIGDEISRTDAQIRELAPGLLAREMPADTPTGGVKLAARELNGALYLIAVNTSESTVSAVLHVPQLGHRIVDVFEEGRSLTASGDSLADEFAPLAVHLYIVPPFGWNDDSTTARSDQTTPALDLRTLGLLLH